MSASRRGLGRGLEALIPGTGDESTSGASATADIDSIEPNPLQPRTRWDEDVLEALAESIRKHGVIQPIVVTRRGEHRPYQIIAGERRWRAARRAGLSSVPILVREATRAEVLELALVENIQRADLNPLEEALAYRHMTDEFGLTQAQIADRVGRSRPSVANTLRLLNAPDDVREAIANDELSAGHAKALLSITDREAQSRALERILRGRLTVRQAEQLAQTIAAESPRVRHVQHDTRADRPLEDNLSRTFRTKVEVQRAKRGGRIVIHFFSDEELTSIATRMLSDDDL